MALFYPCMKIKNFLDQMYSSEVLNNTLLYFFQKVLLAPSKCLFRWIKVDKLDYLKNRPCDFKNSFLGGIVEVSSMPGMGQ